MECNGFFFFHFGVIFFFSPFKKKNKRRALTLPLSPLVRFKIQIKKCVRESRNNSQASANSTLLGVLVGKCLL